MLPLVAVMAASQPYKASAEGGSGPGRVAQVSKSDMLSQKHYIFVQLCFFAFNTPHHPNCKGNLDMLPQVLINLCPWLSAPNTWA